MPSWTNAIVVGSAVSLAAMALWNTYRARKAEREHPPRGHFLEIDGVRLHDLERGRRPAGGRPSRYSAT
jgi:hypothetical protein